MAGLERMRTLLRAISAAPRRRGDTDLGVCYDEPKWCNIPLISLKHSGMRMGALPLVCLLWALLALAEHTYSAFDWAQLQH